MIRPTIRKTILAIAAVATIAGAAATSAQAGGYGHSYNSFNNYHVSSYRHTYHAPAYYTKCFRKIVGYKRVYNYYGGYFTKPITRKVCKRFYR